MTDETNPVAEDAADVAAPYRTATWQGIPLYECTQCPFDALNDEDAIIRHVALKHVPPPAPAPIVRATPLVDRFGNPIEVTETLTEEATDGTN